MITSLSIKNFALIDDISVQFGEGLTVITGETGAGKSILLGALALLLGRRADLSSVKNTSKKCIVEAGFSVAAYGIEDFFEESGLDYEPQTIIRREILPSGKSRAFVNDSPTNLSALFALGDRLVHIHSQRQTQELLSEEFQLGLLDVLAGSRDTCNRFAEQRAYYFDLKKELEQCRADRAEAEKQSDYNTFLLDELKEAGLQPEEETQLEEEQETLSRVEDIREAMGEADQMLHVDGTGVLEAMRAINNRLERLKDISDNYHQLYDRFQSVMIELDDIAGEISGSGEGLEADPQRLVAVQSRLDELYRLQKKHNVGSSEELIQIRDELAATVRDTAGLEEKMERLHNELVQAETELKKLSATLHRGRQKTIPKLIQKLEDYLKGLGMPKARFQLVLTDAGAFLHNGSDKLRFLFTANEGRPFGEIKKTASGGEQGRIMLAVKSILSSRLDLPTIVFDEIDTGVSGEVANKMADILRQMGERIQVLCITHLPQIAAKGSRHLRVYKEEKGGRTSTFLSVLSHEERVVELSQMLSGEKQSSSALAHAKELLN